MDDYNLKIELDDLTNVGIDLVDSELKSAYKELFKVREECDAKIATACLPIIINTLKRHALQGRNNMQISKSSILQVPLNHTYGQTYSSWGNTVTEYCKKKNLTVKRNSSLNSLNISWKM